MRHRTRLVIALALALTGRAVLAAVPGGATAPDPSVIYWVSAPVLPGETVLMCGHFPEPDALQVAVQRLSDRNPGKPPESPGRPPELEGSPRTLAPLQATETAVMFELPERRGPGVYDVAVLTDGAPAAVARLNDPVAWWALGDVVTSQTPFGEWRIEDAAAHAGGSLRVVGRCLQLGERAPSVALRAMNGKVTVLRPSQAEPYSLTVSLPDDLASGRCELFVHNGYGGRRAWSNSLPLAVLPAEEPEEILIDAADYGADGDDDGDDTGAIKSALKAAGQRRGGVVLIPRGRFVVSEKLVIPPYVTLRGAGRELTALCMADTDDPPDAWVEGSHHFAIEDLTLYCNHHIHVISNTDAAVHGHSVAYEDPEAAGHVRLARVRVRADSFRGHLPLAEVVRRTDIRGPRDTVRLTGPDIRISDCDFYGSNRSINLHYVVGGQVENTIFYNGRSGWMNFNGCENVVFAHNRLVGADLMASGGGYACFTRGVSRHIYTAHNSYENLNGWDREAFTSDAGGGAYYGGVASGAGDTLVLAEDPEWQGRDWTNTLVGILAGRGRGQFRSVRSWDGRRVQLDRPFDVPPDETSRITVTMTHRRYIFYNNECRDAGIAIQFYGTATEHIVADNRCWRTDGYRAYGMSYTGGVQPNFYLQFLGNQIMEGNCYRYAETLVYPSHLSVEGTLPSLHFGSVMRRNHLHNNAGIEVVVGANSDGATENVVVEDNIVEHTGLGILVDPGCRGVLLRRNQVERCAVPVVAAGPDIWLHPGEKLGYRVESARTHLGESEAFERLRKMAADLAAAPYSPDLAGRYEKGLGALLQAVARQKPVASPELLQALLGLSFAATPDSGVAHGVRDGRGGTGELQIRVRTEAWSPEIEVRAEVLPMPGWEQPGPAEVLPAPGGDRPGAGPGVVLAPAGSTLVRIPVRAPPQTTRRRVPYRVTATYQDVSLAADGSVDLGPWRPTQWAVIGPFPNGSGRADDPQLHAPELRLDLNQPGHGIKGLVRWQPLQSPTINFGSLLRPGRAATAYALAVLRTPEDLTARLHVSCRGHARLWLNEDELGECGPTSDTSADTTHSAQLEAGDNLVLAKSSFLSGPWDLTLEVEETLASEDRLVRVSPVAELWQLPELAPPARSETPGVGPLDHDAGVSWRQVYADGFEARQLARAWRRVDGKWKVRRGVLVGGEQAFILLRQRIEAPVRIEYDTRAESPHDLSALWTPDLDDQYAGYLIAFAQRSTGSRIQYPGADAVFSDDPLARGVPNQWHHVIAQVLADGTAQLVVDGHLLLELDEVPEPTAPGYAGLWTWQGGEFDNVRIFAGE